MPLILDRTQAPEAQPIKSFSLLPAQKLELVNGIETYLINGGRQPMINLQLIIRLGKWEESQQGQAVFMGKMLGEGTTHFSSQEISEQFESLGAYWGISTGADWLDLSLLCLNKHLDKLLPILVELLTEATFPEKEFDYAKHLAVQQLLVNKEKVSYESGVLFKKHLFGETHPYGYSLNEENIQGLNRAAIQSFYQKILKRKDALLFVSGQIEEEHLASIQRHIGGLTFENQLQHLEKEVPTVIQQKKYYEEKEGALQSSIKLGRLVCSKQDEKHIAFQVLNTILGGYFGSRLMQNIREEKGLSYGINSSVTFMKDRGVWMINSEVQKEKKELALVEIYKELEQLKTVPVGEKELNLVKNYIAGSFVKAINSPTSIINCHKSMRLYQLPSGYYTEYIPKIWEVKASELQELANEYFTDDLLEVVVG